MLSASGPIAPPFTRRGIKRGFIRAQPLAWSVLLYGMVFGVLAASRLLSPLEAVLMSALVYSSSAQMAALQGWPEIGEFDASAVLPIVATILIMNARYILYGAALRPWLGGLGAAPAYGSLYFLGDGNWALAMQERDAGDDDAGFLLGSGLVMFIGWTAGTLVGHLLGGLVTQPERFGIDFMLAAFSAALLMGLHRGRRDLWATLGAVLVAVVLAQLLPSGWVIVMSGLAAALIGYVTYDHRA